MSNNIQKTLLPFISMSQVDDVTLEEEIEKATVFCLAELEREKGGGIFRKQAPEKIVYVSEVYYPFWIVPFRNLTLIFDGLNLSSHTTAYPALPDTNAFKDNLNQLASSRQAYASFLSDNLNYFHNSEEEQNQSIEGLITDVEFLNEFVEYSKEAQTTDATVNGVLVAPAQDETQIGETLKALENLRLKLEKDLEELNQVIKTLDQQSEKALAGLRDEIKATEDKFGGQIEETKTIVAEKRAQINKEYSDKVTEVSDNFEQELIGLHKEIITLQKTAEDIESELADIDNEIKTALVNKDENAEFKLKEKKEALKQQLPHTKAAIKGLQTKVDEIGENKKNALFQLKEENDENLKAAGNELIELESHRDAEIKACKDEMERIEDYTSTIIGKIDKLTKISAAALDNFDNLGLRQEQQSNQLVYMPFYLTCYQSGPNTRCMYFAPSITGNDGLGARLRGIGKKKITYLFQSRSQKIVSLLNHFLSLLNEDIAFSHEIDEACRKANLLKSTDAVESIKKGLNKLWIDGWLSDGEFESFNKILK